MVEKLFIQNMSTLIHITLTVTTDTAFNNELCTVSNENPVLEYKT